MILAAVFLAGCGSSGAEPPAGMLSDERFAEVYVALRVAAHESQDRQEFEARRDTILQRHGVDDHALGQFVEYRSKDIAGLASLWRRIEADLDSQLGPGPDREATPRGLPDTATDTERRLSPEPDRENVPRGIPERGPDLEQRFSPRPDLESGPSGIPDRDPSPGRR